MNSRDIIRSLMSNSESVIYFKDTDGHFTMVNQKWVDLYGAEPSEIIGKRYFKRYSQQIAAEARTHELEVQTFGEVRTVEESVTEADGMHYYLASRFPVYNDERELGGTGAIFVEISANKRLEADLRASRAALQEMVSQDQLTGAFSRKAFYEQVDAEVLRHHRYHHPLSLMLFDLDHFKLVNQRFGYGVGDRILMRVVALSQNVLRETDRIYRIEGESFAIIAPETDIEGGKGLAKRILQAIREESFEQIDALTASIGVTEVVDGDDLDPLLSRLEEALAEAKADGRNRIVVRDR